MAYSRTNAVAPNSGQKVRKFLSGEEVLQGVMNSTQDGLLTENVAIGAKADAVATTDTGTFSLIALIKRGLQTLTSLLARGAPYTGTATLTRAANTTAYTAGDVVGGVVTLASIGPSGGEILLTALRALFNISALPSGMGSFTVHVYDTSPASAIADNSPWTLGSGDRAAYLGKIEGLTFVALGTGTQSVFAAAENINQQFKLASASTSLYLYFVTNVGYTPAANSETASIKGKAIGL